MTDKPTTELKEYAGGWITERKGTSIPPFLKLAYPIIAIACLVYLFVFMNGEVNHSTRGALVRQFNAVTQSSSGFMYAVAALIAIFVVILLAFVYGKSKHED
jgi:choline-glycine betaine transporter